MKSHIFIFLLLAVTFSTCKPKDPCIGALGRCAIKLYENLFSYRSRTDTVLQGAQVIFSAYEGYDSYAWRIGNDPRIFTNREFMLYLREDDLGNIPVRLITTRSPNPDCFANDTGIDTTYATLTVVSDASSKLTGKFKGKTLETNSSEYTAEVIKF